MSSVTVICPNGHRCVVKVTPGMQLRKVLEEACLKQGYDADEYGMKFQNREVDMGLTFRLTGMPNNATLEMHSITNPLAAKKVEIALQLADGSRKFSEFLKECTLLDVLGVFSVDFQVELVNLPKNFVPSCAYMGKEYRGTEELAETTLKSIGILSGRALIRYSTIHMSDEQVEELRKRSEDERARKEKLMAGFEERREANIRRELLESFYERKFEKELEAKRIADEAAARERATPGRESSEDKEQGSVLVTGTVIAESGEVTPRTAVSAHTPITRLGRLESLLDQVNSELDPTTVNVGQVAGATAASGQHHAGASNAPASSVYMFANYANFANFKFPDVPIASAVAEDITTGRDGTESSNETVSESRCDRRAVVFCASNGRLTPVEGNTEIDDRFFDLSVADAKKLQRALSEDIKSQEERALVPKALIIRKNRELKEAAYKHTVIRFMVGKRMLQGNFLSREPVSHVYEFVRERLNDKEMPFEVQFALNQKIADDANKSIIDADLAPCATLYLKLKKVTDVDESLFSKSDVVQVTHGEACRISMNWLSGNEPFIPFVPLASDSSREESARPSGSGKRGAKPEPETEASSSGRPHSAVRPKWFKPY